MDFRAFVQLRTCFFVYVRELIKVDELTERLLTECNLVRTE